MERETRVSSFPLNELNGLIITQKRELAELIGFETRNKYEIKNEQNQVIGFCAEQRSGFLGAVMRYFLGHWRTFELHFFDSSRQLNLKAVHPFRFFFQRLEVFLPGGSRVGAIQQRFGILRKRFDLENESGQVELRMESGFFSFWTFPIYRNGQEVATVQKRWSGFLKEVFTDGDNFHVKLSPSLQVNERWLVLAASIFVDLQYFERKAD